MPLQSTPPDTSAFMIAGYVAFAVIFAIYLVSFIIRRRNLEQDLKTLEGIRAESRMPSQPAPIVKARAKSGAARSPARKSRTTRKKVTLKR